MSTHEIVFIGGGSAAVVVAHMLLKKQLAKVSKHNPGTTYHITMISTASDWYWNIGAPRQIINTSLMPDNTLFASIPDNFKQYGDKFTFIHGKTTSLNPDNKSVTIQCFSGDDNKESDEMTITYDSLVIASGSRTNSAIWRTGNGSKTQQLTATNQFRTAVANAKTIMIGGAGPIGVESAGEIGFEYGAKGAKVTLICPTPYVLASVPQGVGQFAEKLLKQSYVDVMHGVKVDKHEKLVDDGNEFGRTRVYLNDGTTHEVDVYLDATGVTPNNEFIPPSLLDDHGFLPTSANLRVVGIPHAYALGDIVSKSKRTGIAAGNMAPIVVNNMVYDLSGGKEGTEQKYEFQEKMIMLVPVGRKKGAGVLFGWNMFSFMVWFIKGRSYLVEMFQKQVSGAAF